MSDAVLKIGVAGLGRWGQRHLEAIGQAQGVECVAVHARSGENPTALPCDRSYAGFLARPEVAAVIIAVPNYLHFEFAKQALLAGKHVLVEKPMSFRRQECDELIGLANEKNLVLAPGHEFRFFTIWAKVKQLLADGAIGQVRFGAIDLWRYPYMAGAGGWRHNPAQVGDWLLEEPIHYFDLALWFKEGVAPNRIYAVSSAGAPERVNWHENLSAFITFEDESYINFTRTVAASNFRIRMGFTGTEGMLEAVWQGSKDIDPNPQTAIMLYKRGAEQPDAIVTKQKTGHWFDLYRQVEAFGRMINRGQKPAPTGTQPAPVSVGAVVTGLDGRRAVYLCEAAKQSLESNQPVELGDWV
jgi:myo-inositol 2-dehydrogenase / D-chiro-inositol 1-dehydrogenase